MYLAAILMLFSLYLAHAQVGTHYLQKGEVYKNFHLSKKGSQITHKMPTFDLAKTIKEDEDTMRNTGILRFGKGFDVSYTLDDGLWEETEGGRLWTMNFVSKGALSLNFVLNDLYLPKGAELYVSSQDGTVVFGPVTSEVVPGNGFLLTDILPGEQATISVFEPLNCKGHSSLSIKRIVHGYKDVGAVNSNMIQNRDITIPNVACKPEYTDESDAVVLILRGTATEVCSGSMLMSTDKSFRGYILTAFNFADTNNDNSISSSEAANAQNCSFKFHYKTISCEDTIMTEPIMYYNALFRAAWPNTKFLLLEIGGNIWQDTSLTWLGWDHNGYFPSSGACIHHPELNGLKISLANSSNQISSSFIPGLAYSGNAWQVIYDEGARHYGTYGAPLLDEHHRVIGQETYENLYSPLTLTSMSHFGRLNVSWNGGNSSDTRLKDWLDPLNSGAMTINSSKPLANVNINGSSIINGSGTYYVQNLPSGMTVAWSLSDNYYNQYCLQQNSPSANQCNITCNNSHALINATLTAKIYQSNTLIQTLRKTISAHVFVGTYYNGVTTKQVNLPYPMYVKKNANLSLQSPNLINATVTHEGNAAVSSFSFNSTTGKVNFYLTSNGTCLVKVNCDNGDHFELPFIVTDNTNILNVAIGNGQLEVSLEPVGEEELRNLGYADLADNLLKSEPQQWTLEVFSATTGEKVFSQEVDGTNYIIDTTGWKPGVYVVRAVIGDEVLNEKVVVN